MTLCVPGICIYPINLLIHDLASIMILLYWPVLCVLGVWEEGGALSFQVRGQQDTGGSYRL